MDSTYYSHAAIWAVRRAGACFSVTAQLNLSVKAAIAAIPAARLDTDLLSPGAMG